MIGCVSMQLDLKRTAVYAIRSLLSITKTLHNWPLLALSNEHAILVVLKISKFTVETSKAKSWTDKVHS